MKAIDTVPVLLLSVVLSCSSGTGDPGDDSGGVDARDIAAEEGEPDCVEDAWECSDDGYVLRLCTEGAWKEFQCMRDQGRLCDKGACVDPWTYGGPQWGTCDDDPLATQESLAEKAAWYDDIAVRMHIHPKAGWIMSGRINRVEVTCPAGKEPPCWEPAVPESKATWQDMEEYWSGENDGLWNGLYLASQAYRYAVTKDAAVLDTIRTILDGEVIRMEITGVPGVFTRQYVPPEVPGVNCPTDLKHYVPDVEKDDNRWVRVGDTGCVETVDGTTMEWVTSDHCGLDKFAGWCWLDNVSQDEYAGHMFALGALAKLVDDPGVQATVKDLLEQVGLHLVDNHLAIRDWDGRVTEHGKFWITSIADSPGFLATESLGFLKMTGEVSGNQKILDFYDNCLLQRAGKNECMPWELEPFEPYTDFLNMMLMYNGPNGGCKSNFNNYSMLLSYIHNLLWFENDPSVREVMQEVFDTEVMRFDSPRALILHGNAWYNFVWAAFKRLGPGSDGHDLTAVEDAICSLRQYPASKHIKDADTYATHEHFCEGRLGGSQTEFPIPVAERCIRKFLWWSGPYQRQKCTEVTIDVHFPGDYLLAYWMGRYHGFISADL